MISRDCPPATLSAQGDTSVQEVSPTGCGKSEMFADPVATSRPGRKSVQVLCRADNCKDCLFHGISYVESSEVCERYGLGGSRLGLKVAHSHVIVMQEPQSVADCNQVVNKVGYDAIGHCHLFANPERSKS